MADIKLPDIFLFKARLTFGTLYNHNIKDIPENFIIRIVCTSGRSGVT